MENNLSPVLIHGVLKSQLVPNIPTPLKLWARSIDDIFVSFPNDHNHVDYLISLNNYDDYLVGSVPTKDMQKTSSTQF